jgi:hypothetical protein
MMRTIDTDGMTNQSYPDSTKGTNFRSRLRMVRNIARTPKMFRVLRQRYLVVTMKGIAFVEEWYMAEHIPSNLTRVYQLLLKLIQMKGTMTTNLTNRLGYTDEVLKLATSRDYVTVNNRPTKPSGAVHNKISKMIGEAPRDIYA